MSSVPQRHFTVEEYLAREERSATKHEFYRGEIFAMAGRSLAHGMIATNIVIKLSQLLRGRGCRPYSNDHRIFIPDVELHTYPDAAVVCGEPIMSEVDPYAIKNPIVIIEVLSPTTESYDSGKKFALYRRIESFRDYLLVDQFEPRVECFSRGETGTWKIDAVEGIDAQFTIPALKCELTLRDIYQDVKFLPHDSVEMPKACD